jgi:uncharacterized protein (DUF58 family)
MPLLSAELRQRLGRMTLRSKRRGSGVRVGERRSVRRGQSQEFADHRAYVPGDDLRFLDWHLLARLDTLWIKLFEEEDDRTIQLLIDTSASMEGEKLQYSREIAAALSFVSLARADRVVVAGLSDRVAHYAPGRRGRGATTPVFKTLEGLVAGGGTDIARALDTYPRQRGSGIGLLFTDFLFEDGIDGPLRRLRSRVDELHVFHILAPSEVRPNLDGDFMLIDQETGEELPVTLNDAALDRYQASVKAYCEDVEAACRRFGVGYSRVLTSTPIDELILRDLRRQGVVG